MKKYCEVCNNKLPKINIDLGDQPLCDDLIRLKSNKKSILYKIKISLCKKCLTVNQLYKVKTQTLFPKSYHYRSGLTEDVLNSMKDLCSSVNKYFNNKKGITVLDIGCNDGSLLNFFYKNKFNTIGVEPTGAAKECKKNHKIYNNYFDQKISKQIIEEVGKVDVITFTNVFAHINNFSELSKSLKLFISNNPKILIVIENHYLGSILNKNQFDTFYQEHPRTYSVTSFEFISKILNINICKLSFPKRYGGNIRVFLSKDKKINIDKFLNFERRYFISQFNKMPKLIDAWIQNKKNILLNLVKDNNMLIGKAFPGRASILINLLKLDNTIIRFICEKKGSKKIGYKVPGTNIPIVSDYNLLKIKNRKKYKIINFAWHIKNEIKNYLRQKKINNKMINILEKNDFLG